MNWPHDYIGKPFVPGARGPDAFDCWGLVFWLYALRGIRLPEYAGILPGDPAATRAINLGAEAGEWREIKPAAEGCVVGLSKHRAFHHVGIFTLADGGLVVHANEGGVMAQSLASLKLHGWRRIAFFQHSHDTGLPS